MASQYRDGRRKQRHLNDHDGRESFAKRNQETGRYPSKEYPSDSYYTRSDEYRQYVSGRDYGGDYKRGKKR